MIPFPTPKLDWTTETSASPPTIDNDTPDDEMRWLAPLSISIRAK
jgi:hypothetical protein